MCTKAGSRRTRGDLVVFTPDDRHDQENAYLIVECKSQKIRASDRKEGVGQLQSYLSACPNAAFGMWTNGLERFCYRRAVRNGQVAFDEIPDIPSFGQTEEDAEPPRFDQLKAASSDALLFAFRRCHNYIAGNQGLQKPEAFWELLKLIFCKIHDERTSDVVEFYASSQERHGLNGQLKVKGRLDRLFAAVRSDYPTIFKPNEVVELNPPVLSYIVTQLQMYSLLESDVDVKGRAYEEIVGANLRGARGEFFTPRNVCNPSRPIRGSSGGSPRSVSPTLPSRRPVADSASAASSSPIRAFAPRSLAVGFANIVERRAEPANH